MEEYPSIRFATDLASLALFDPAVLSHRVRSPGTWWRDDPLLLPEMAQGRMIIAPIGRDGDYGVRLTFTGPIESERPYLRESVGGLGVEVTSGELFVGPAERLPGDGGGDRLAALPGQGRCLETPLGCYTATITALDWAYDDQWFDDDGEVVAGAPPDFLVHLIPLPAGTPFERGEDIPTLLSLRARPEVKVAPASAPTMLTRRRPTPAKGRRGLSSAPRRPRLSPRAGALSAALSSEPSLWPRWREGEKATFASAELRPLGEAKSLLWTPADVAKKVTRVREQLRVLEQKVNSSGLRTFDKVELQGEITTCYEVLIELGILFGAP